MRTRLVAVITFVIVGCAIAALMTIREKPAQHALREPVAAPVNSTPVAPQISSPSAAPSPHELAQISKSAAPVAPKQSAKQNSKGKGASAQANSSGASDVPQDKPIERVALSYVGADPAAEAIWFKAINDPQTSAHDRSDLIEDLNEEGFENPHNPTFDDLPLIENRLAIIESLAPDSMDDVNAAAFAEAYKDLVHMRARLVGQ
jgi:hypothetical protein